MNNDIQKQLADLKQVYESGALPEDTYRNLVAALESQTTVIAEGQGATAVGARGVVVGGDVGGSVVTGDGSRVINAEQHIENFYAAPEDLNKDNWRAAYLHRVLNSAGRLSLAGVDPKAAADESGSRLQLSSVYTALLTYGMEAKGGEKGGLFGLPQTGGRQLSALAQLDQYPHLVLLGDPGSGKSTFSQFVAFCLAGECVGHESVNLSQLTQPLPDENGDDEADRQPWSHGALLPLLVILRDFAANGLPPIGEPASANDLWQFIEKDLEAASLADLAPYLQQELLEKGGLLLLDGLDEVPQANQRREQIKQVVEDFADTYPKMRILVTSRTYAYQQQSWQLADFTAAVLVPFSQGQIRRFIDRWYAHVGSLRGLQVEDAQGRAEQLKQAIFASTRLGGLAERPLLLTLMASLHAWRGGSLPEKREELYADTVDLLLDWWESQRVVRDAQGNTKNIQPSLAEWLKVDRVKVRQLLHHLAYEAHAAQSDLVGTADIPEGDLVSGLMRLSQNPDVNPARLVEYLTHRAGLLLPRGIGVYTFPHRTFQEYLAACYLTDHDYPDAIAELVRNDPNRWREVALLAGAKATRGSTSTLWSLVEALCYQEPNGETADAWGAHLAGQALVELNGMEHVNVRHQQKVDRVRRWLVEIVQGNDLPAVERALAATHLAELGDLRPEVTTVNAMQFCYVPAGPFWMGSDEDNPLEKDAERPPHQLEMPYDYWVGRFPVTNAQFAEFVEDGGYGEESFWGEAKAQNLWRDGKTGGYTYIVKTREWEEQWRDRPYDYGRSYNRSNQPVVGIHWYEALAYTRWLTSRWQANGQLSSDWKIALPNEPQWEKAARGGFQMPVQPLVMPLSSDTISSRVSLQTNPMPKRPYPWVGNEAQPELANYDDTSIGQTSGCGCFNDGQSPYGCEEMAGNMFEWTRSVWGRYDSKKSEGGKIVFDPLFSYPYMLDDDREALSKDTRWVRSLRGGSWNGDMSLMRCASRFGSPPAYRLAIIGFRVVCVPISHSGR